MYSLASGASETPRATFPREQQHRLIDVLMTSCATVALMLVPVAVGVTLPSPAAAQTQTLPASTSGAILDSYTGFTDFLVTNGTTINDPSIAVMGGAGTRWTLSNQGTIIGDSDRGVSLAGGGVVTNGGTANTTALISGGGDGVNAGQDQTVSNFGTITGGDHGVLLNAGGSVINTGAASSIIGGYAVYIAGGAGTVTNDGSIVGAGRGVSLALGGLVTNGGAANATARIEGDNGVFTDGALATVTNFGTIAGGAHGVMLNAGGSLANTGVASSIYGDNGVRIENAAGTVTNDGSIGGGNHGVSLALGGLVTNGGAANTDARIEGDNGVFTDGALATVTNFGTIAGRGLGVMLNAGGSVANTGVASSISGDVGVRIENGAGTVTNDGSIVGGWDRGVSLGGGGVVINGGSANADARIEGANDGIYADADQTVSNFGTITAVNGHGVILNAGGSVANTGTASSISGGTGVYIQHGVGTVTNAGTIIGTGQYGVGIVYVGAGGNVVTNTATGVISGGFNGVGFYDAPATVNNSGRISGILAYGVNLDSGQVINNAGGTISGDSGMQIASGTVNNSGIITATGTGTSGVRINTDASVINTASGAISGEIGVWMNQGGTVINTGVITGTGPSGIGVKSENDVFGTLDNAGTIIGEGGAAVSFGSGGGGVLVVHSTSAFIGDVLGGGAATLELANDTLTNAVTLTGVFTDFSTIQVDAGANWTFASDRSFGPGVTLTNAGTLTNQGTIDGTVAVDGASAMLTNSGQITGTTDFAANIDGGRMVNNLGGTISGASGVQVGTGTLNNSGVITATAVGGVGLRSNSDANILTNTATGAISGEIAVYITNGGTVINTGVITGTGASGIGVKVSDFQGITLDTSGSVIGNSGTAVSFGSKNDRLVLHPTATFTGAVLGGAGGNTLELAGDTLTNVGTLTGVFTNFDTVKVDAGANWTLTSDRTFGSGTTFTNAGSLTNQGTINNTVTLSGTGVVLNNSGLISGVKDGVNGLLGGSGSVTNTGTIRGTQTGQLAGVLMLFGGAVTNQGSASVISGTYGVRFRPGADGARLTNDGTITGAIQTGVILDGVTGNVVNNATGFITGAQNGVYIDSTGTITNAGSISGVSSSGAKLDSGALTNLATGVITASGTASVGVKVLTSGAVTNNASAKISGVVAGVAFAGAGANTLANSGTISASGATGAGVSLTTAGNVGNTATGKISGVATGVSFAGAGAHTLANSGTIGASGTSGTGVSLATAGNVSNTATGQISGVATGVAFTGAGVNTLANSGTITASGTAGTGVKLTSVGNVGNAVGGQIQGGLDGVNLGGIGTVVNAGAITGTADAGVVLHAGGGLTNSGSITGTTAGVIVEGGLALITNTGTIVGSGTAGVGVLFTGGAGTIDNFGTISGLGGSAIKFVGGVNKLILEDGSKLIGLADGGGGTNTLLVRDQATLSNVNIIGFQTVVFTGPTTPPPVITDPTDPTGPVTGPNQTIDVGSTVTNPAVISGTLVNHGTLKGVVSVSEGATLSSTGEVSIDAPSDNSGVIANTGSITNLSTLTNTGTLANAGGLTNGGTLVNDGQLINTASLTNSGVINGAGAFANTGSFTNSGTVTGRVDGVTGGGVITNSGRIIGVVDTGVDLGAGGVLINTSAGFIQGGAYGVQVGAGGTVINAGVILDDDVAGLALGDRATLTNSGTLGGVIGLKFTGIGADAVNSGAINGTGGVAVQFGSGVNHLTLTTGSVLNGGIDGGGGASQITLTGTGALSSPITNFGTGGSLAIATGAIWTASGAWSIGSVTNAGALRLGTAVDALRLSGNFVQMADGTLRVAINAAGQSSQLRVTGAATLNGALSVTAANGAYQPSTTYVILTSSALTGKFTSVSTDLAFLTPTVRYDAQNAYLTVTTPVVPVDFSSAAITRNQHDTANAVQAGGETSALYKAVLGQSVSGARRAFNALSGEVYASANTTLADDGRVVAQTMLGQLWRSAQAAGTDGSDSRVTGWGEVAGGWGRINGDRDDNAATVEQDRSGFMTGMDARIGQAWRVGMAGGYNSSDLKIVDRGSSAKIGAYTLGVYAGGALGALNVRVGAAHSWSDVDVGRSVVFPNFQDAARSSYDAKTGQVFGEVGYRLAWRTATIEPFAGLSYIDLKTDAANEQGAAASLSVAGSSASQTYSTLGLRTASRWSLSGDMVLEPRMTIAWRHAQGDLTPETDVGFAGASAGFSVTGAALARDAALMELGVDLARGDSLKLGVSYRGALSKTVQDNALAAVLSWSF